MKKRIVIVGAGHAAGQAVSVFRQKNVDAKIVLIGDEEHLPYQRPPLSKKFLSGKLEAARLFVKPRSFYDEGDVETHLGTRIDTLNLSQKVVVDSNDNSHAYDNLIVATGARPRKLNLPGAELDGIFYLRDIQDALLMQRQMRPGNRLVVIGAGYIGLEVAAVAVKAGLNVTIIEMADRVMSRVVSEPVSKFYQSEHERHGVQILLSTGLTGFSGNSVVDGVVLDDGTSLPADLVLVGIGAEPNVEIAQNAGLDVEDGIRVDDRCKTSEVSVYAIGDCTNHPNSLLGRRLRLESVHNALEQAKTAAGNICGDDLHYAQIPWFWSDQYDLKLQIAGISQGYDQTILRGDPSSSGFSCLYLQEGKLIAVDAINSPRDFVQSKALIASRATIRSDIAADVTIALKDSKPEN